MNAIAGFDEIFVEFAQELRVAGLSVGTDDVLSFCQGVSKLDPSDLVDVYWSGRSTLVKRKDHLDIYTRIFRRFFLNGENNKAQDIKMKFKSSTNTQAVLDIPDVESGSPGSAEEEIKMGLVSSTSEIYRNKSFKECNPQELASLRRMISKFKLSPPKRVTRRISSNSNGSKIHMRKMLREFMRRHGEIKEIFYIQRNKKLRPLIFILDVSGSMADYSRNLIQLAYSARRANSRVEVFCFGTRLTRITKSLEKRNPDEAMRIAGETVLDWDGGTRIGESINSFIKGWGRGGMSRGAIIVICSDGLDRGDPKILEEAMSDLSRLSYKIIWMNPHKGDAIKFEPNTLGMIVCDPFIDLVVSGHNLETLEQFTKNLTALR